MDLERAFAAYRTNEPKAEDVLVDAVIRTVLPIFAAHFDSATTEDLCQEVVALVFSKLDVFVYRGPGCFAGWVLRIARNHKLAQQDRENRLLRLKAAFAHAIPPKRLLPTELMQWRERLELVLDVIAGIESKYTAAMLHLASGGDPNELAEAAGVQRHTVFTRASRGVQNLRQEIDTHRSGPTPFLATPKTWG